MTPPQKKVHVFIVSDATGTTAERVIGAALVQFAQVAPVFRRFAYVKTRQEIEAILHEASQLNAIVIYSLVSKELRHWIRALKRDKEVYAIDLLGPLLIRLQRMWNMIPALRPGIYGGIGEDTYRLAESIDYTLKHDDGQNIATLPDADLVILGVSRTSKTPTSLFLSCNYNLKVANIPVIPQEPLPEEVINLPLRKAGFLIAAEKLAQIRQKRMLYSGESAYSDLAAIRSEIRYCQRQFRNISGLRVLDVTNSPIEEIANRVLQSFGLQEDD